MSPTTSLFNTTKVIDLSLGFGDQDTVLDPSALILSFGIAIGILPIIVVVVIDPILNTRTTLRDLLNVYYGEYIIIHHTSIVKLFILEHIICTYLHNDLTIISNCLPHELYANTLNTLHNRSTLGKLLFISNIHLPSRNTFTIGIYTCSISSSYWY